MMKRKKSVLGKKIIGGIAKKNGRKGCKHNMCIFCLSAQTPSCSKEDEKILIVKKGIQQK